LDDLRALLEKAPGADPKLDALIAEYFGVAPGDFTASIEKCRSLVKQVLPGWHLHLGFGASGLFPYATVSEGAKSFAAEAPTAPMAILRAMSAAGAGSTKCQPPEDAGR
jgi:hypothetical protein